MNFSEFKSCVNQIINNKIPPELMKNLNMGIIIMQETKAEDDYYIMGEYINDDLGKYVVLYYGSFNEILENKTDKKWQEEILSTIKHELTHHVEALAGEEKLAKFEELEELKELEKNKPKKDTLGKILKFIFNNFPGKRKN
ncbi:metallopeptidase family protein [Natranaerofaba carboxydovora]|uniref:metallopeptidase family protein n=1 Tax=Natranaerofaba carboxydovora TaxID=2742683 RepID=UPI001F139896|nr:metallopeptidase family protein [Natranaerofaba carboxydovora]UMZ73614.1 Zincin-like metallopeptidase [Natranaerofaba carboxydovora]